MSGMARTLRHCLLVAAWLTVVPVLYVLSLGPIVVLSEDGFIGRKTAELYLAPHSRLVCSCPIVSHCTVPYISIWLEASRRARR
jgi:hypothetical protein